jgi:predicted membrane protein
MEFKQRSCRQGTLQLVREVTLFGHLAKRRHDAPRAYLAEHLQRKGRVSFGSAPQIRASDCFCNSRSTRKMPLLNLVVVLIVVGVLLYLINRYIPMASSIKTILNIVVVVAVCVWVLQAVGLWASVTNFRFPSSR